MRIQRNQRKETRSELCLPTMLHYSINNLIHTQGKETGREWSECLLRSVIKRSVLLFIPCRIETYAKSPREFPILHDPEQVGRKNGKRNY